MLVDFITEITATGDPHKDFRLLQKTLNVLRHSAIADDCVFEGVHSTDGHTDEECIVPFFGYDAHNETTSPHLPDVKPEKGVRRWFCSFGSLATSLPIDKVFGTYEIPMKPITHKGEKIKIHATICICGCAVAGQTKHTLRRIGE